MKQEKKEKKKKEEKRRKKEKKEEEVDHTAGSVNKKKTTKNFNSILFLKIIKKYFCFFSPSCFQFYNHKKNSHTENKIEASIH
jgi:hypothetical protein